MTIQVNVVGLNIAKSVFQVHGVDRHGQAVLRKRLRRSQVHTTLAGHVVHRPPCFYLLPRSNDLRLAVLAPAHADPPLSPKSYLRMCGSRGDVSMTTNCFGRERLRSRSVSEGFGFDLQLAAVSVGILLHYNSGARHSLAKQ
jgi:hypothetical protein